MIQIIWLKCLRVSWFFDALFSLTKLIINIFTKFSSSENNSKFMYKLRSKLLCQRKLKRIWEIGMSKSTLIHKYPEINMLVQRLCAIYQYSCAKLVKVSKLVQRKLIPYKSIIGSGAFRKIKQFGDIQRQLFCV